MKFRISAPLQCLVTLIISISYSSATLSGYRAFLDPRSMAMGGTGVASSTKFNASAHNPALIAFNRGSKPDKIYFSGSLGTRELYDEHVNRDILNFQNQALPDDFIEKIKDQGSQVGRDIAIAAGKNLINELHKINLSSYRSDDESSFNLLADTDPVTINVFIRHEIRRMTVIVDQDSESISNVVNILENPDSGTIAVDFGRQFSTSVDSTFFEYNEFGATVATTNVIDYNMPIAWGFTPKLIQFSSSHISKLINDYDINDPPTEQPSDENLEWNLDVGFAMLLTDDFLEQTMDLDGFWLEGEWVFGISGMNMFPTDVSPYSPSRRNSEFVNEKDTLQTLYQIGLANYRENFMYTIDFELSEHETFGFEGLTRFISMGTEYYWRDDFYLRAGLRYNMSQTDAAAKEKTTVSGGFIYQPNGFSIEAAAMIGEVEVGGTVGLGLAF